MCVQVLPSSPGHLLVKTENGQMHLVRVNSSGATGGGQPVVTGGGGVTSATLPATSSHVTLNQVVANNSVSGVVTAHPYRFQQSQVSWPVLPVG